MVPVSIQVRQALSKLVLPVLLLMSVGIIIAGQADRPLADKARMRVADVLAPFGACCHAHRPIANVWCTG